MAPSPLRAGTRWILLLFIVLVACELIVQAEKEWRAERWSRSSSPSNWLRAAQLEPGNGDFWYHLGAYRQWDFEQADLPLAIQYYQRALEDNPYSSVYWTSLASTYEMTGAMDDARKAFEKARAEYPISAEVAWNYGNFLLRQSEAAPGFAEIHRAVIIDPTLIPLAISRCWRLDPDVGRLLNDVLPPDEGAYFQALDFLASARETEAALAVWNRALALGKRFPLSLAFPFLDGLIAQDRAEDARRVWRQALAEAGLPHDEPAGGSAVWNGGFESDLVEGGFDWREESATGMAISFDPVNAHSGARSLRVDFNGGSNLDFHHLYQFVPVAPNRAYHFHAFVRTEAITTESGIRFLLLDPHHTAASGLLTSDLTGTTPWTPVDADFTTGPETHILEIIFRRVPSRLFNNKLAGTVWTDDVSLVPAEATGRSAP